MIQQSAKRGVLIIYTSLVCSLVVGVLLSSLMARQLAPQDLGFYRYFVSALSVFPVAAGFGYFAISGAVLLGARNLQEKNDVLSGLMAFGVVVSILVGLACILLYAFRYNSGGSLLSIWPFLVLCTGLVLLMIFSESFRSSGDYFGVAFVNVLPSLSSLLVLVFILEFLHIKMSGLDVLWVYLASALLVAVGLYWRSASFIVPRWSKMIVLLYRYKAKALDLYWAGLLGVLIAQVGVFYVDKEIGLEALATFSLSLSLSLPLSLLPSSVATAYFSRLGAGSVYPRKALAGVWIISLLTFVVYSLVLPSAVGVLYGDRYLAVADVAFWLGMASILHGLGDFYNRAFLAGQRTRLLLFVAAGLFIISLVSNWILVPLYGLLGASYARVMVSLCYVVLLASLYSFMSSKPLA